MTRNKQKNMWQTLISVFKTKEKTSSNALDTAWAEFDTLMVAVEKDEQDLEQLERHVKEDFLEIKEELKEDNSRVEEFLSQ